MFCYIKHFTKAKLRTVMWVRHVARTRDMKMKLTV
jgi:hypothetical protein